MTHEADVIGDRAHFAQLDNALGSPLGEQEGLRRAGIVLDYAADLAEQVVNGELVLDKASRPDC